MIPYAKHSINQRDIEAVIEVLRSDWLTQGPVVPAFEKALSDYCGADHAVAVSSGTAALHIACLALGLGQGDLLWTSPITFVASANCARYCGAQVDFVDIEPGTGNMSVNALEKKLYLARKNNKIPKIVIPVHFAGNSCDMEAIYALSEEFGFYIIEDASHAMGAEYKGNKVGACRYSDVSVFSFHPAKIMTTGEGGILLTNSIEVRNKALRLRQHGITRVINGEHGDWEYQQVELGYNYRMTDLQAAIGMSQMERLNKFVDRRRIMAERYQVLLKHDAIKLPQVTVSASPSWHLYVVRLMQGIDRKKVFDHMRNNGVGVNVHYIPVHTQPYYRRLGFTDGDFPVAEQYYSETITLPLFYDLTEEQQDFTAEQLLAAVSYT